MKTLSFDELNSTLAADVVDRATMLKIVDDAYASEAISFAEYRRLKHRAISTWAENDALDIPEYRLACATSAIAGELQDSHGAVPEYVKASQESEAKVTSILHEVTLALSLQLTGTPIGLAETSTL